MADERTVDEGMLEQLARLAGIEIEPERRAAIAEQADALLSEANAVNRFMDARRELGPGVRYHHPDLHGDEP